MRAFPVKSFAKKRILLTDFQSGLYNPADEYAVPLKMAKESYDITCSGGALRDGLGLTEGIDEFLQLNGGMFDIPPNLKGMWVYKRYDQALNKRDDRLIAMSGTNLGWISIAEPGNEFRQISNSAFTTVPTAVNYRLDGEDVIIFCSPTDQMLVFDGNTARRVSGAPNITSMAVHYERLFATVGGEKSALWFSDDLDPTNWSIDLNDAGFIEMLDERGELRKVISFLDHLYVFRENGITRVTAFGDQQQFSVSHLFTAGGRIMTDTVTVCGDRILFLTESGLYAFDGYNSVKLLDMMSDRFVFTEKACAEYHNGNYYFSCDFKYNMAAFDKEFIVEYIPPATLPTLFEYDIHKKDLRFMRNVRVQVLRSLYSRQKNSMIMINTAGKLMTVDGSGVYMGVVQNKLWHSAKSDLSVPDMDKTIREIYIRTDKACSLRIKTERGETILDIAGSPLPQRIRTCITGRLFTVTLFSDKIGTYIANISALVYYSAAK